NVGLNTFVWDGSHAPATTFTGMILWGGSTNGPPAAPGRYQVRLNVDGKILTQPLVVKRNPWRDATDADLLAQQNLALQIRDKLTEANAAIVQMREIKRQVTDRLGKSSDDKLKTTGDRLSNNLSDVEDDIYQVKNQSGQDPLNYPIKVNNRLASLLGVVSRSDAKPNVNIVSIFNDLKSELKVETDRYQKVLVTDLPAFNAELRRLGLEAITVTRPVVF
ncbi:MAG TPA: glycosyl hydrolase, partial [Gemmatimonadaceae bacterium]